MSAADRQAELDRILNVIREPCEFGDWDPHTDWIVFAPCWPYIQHDIDGDGDRKVVCASRIRVVKATLNTITVDHRTYQTASCHLDDPHGPAWRDEPAPRLQTRRGPLQRTALRREDACVDGLWDLDDWSPVPMVWDPCNAD